MTSASHRTTRTYCTGFYPWYNDRHYHSGLSMARRMLTAFQVPSAAHPLGRVLALEEEVRAPLIKGTPDLLGRIDLALETSDCRGGHFDRAFATIRHL